MNATISITIFIWHSMSLLCFTELLNCHAVGIIEVKITCEALEQPVFFLCSFSGGPLHSCEFIPSHSFTLCLHVQIEVLFFWYSYGMRV